MRQNHKGQNMHEHGQGPGYDAWAEWSGEDVVDVWGAELNAIRTIPVCNLDGLWEPFPDVGEYQMTRLTAEKTGGACNAYYVRLKGGDRFPIHTHPNATHIMKVVLGYGKILWRGEDSKKYRVDFRADAGFFGITPGTEHAVMAEKTDTDLIFLVINAPAEDIQRHNYQKHVHPHGERHEH